jgi:hypothetical protein
MSWNTSLMLRNIQNEIDEINYVIDNNVDGIGPQGIQGIPGTQGNTGLSGSNGVSLFDITLNGCLLYTSDAADD